MTINTLGILTGISYISGLDYYEGINRLVTSKLGKAHVMAPNPRIVMASVDCDRYVHYLTSGQFNKVDDHLLAGVKQLVDAECDFLAIASNTGHISVPAINAAYPHLQLIHIADCAAAAIHKGRFSKVGLIGTQPTMKNDFLKARLKRHNIETIIPDCMEDQARIYSIICQELSFNIIKEDSREFIISVMSKMVNQGATACLLGCTEIELLVRQENIPDTPLLPSAAIHIKEVSRILLGTRSLNDLLPSA